MPHVDVDGVRIHYRVTGAPSERLPLLLSHGYSASTAMWEPNLAALASERQVVTWDMRGHGKSDSPNDPVCYSEALGVTDMGAVLDCVEAERAVLGGLSLGGYFSLAFYLAHPERVAALVLCDTGPGFKRDESRDAWNRQMEEVARNLEAGRTDVLPERAEVAPAAQQDARGLALAARGLVAQRDRRVIDALPNIRVPALVVVGADDTPFRDAAEYMASKIPGAELVVIPDAGHASNIDQPAEFNRRVLEFLAAVP